MTYRKPVLNGYAAIGAIQSGSSSKNGMNTEQGQNFRTIPAYEADE